MGEFGVVCELNWLFKSNSLLLFAGNSAAFSSSFAL